MAKWESAPVYTPKWASAPTYETPRNRPVADEEDDRTLGDSVNDFVANYGVGAGQIVGLIGSAYGLVTGDMENRLTETGARTSEFWEKRKTPAYLEAEKARQAKIDATEGEFKKAGVAMWETVTNPMLFVGELVKQAPNLAAGGFGAVAARRIATTASAKALASTAAATGTGVGLSSADFGQSAYEQLMSVSDEVWLANPEVQERIGGNLDLLPQVKREIATRLSQDSAIVGGLVTFGLNKLPGAKTIEKALGGEALTGNRLRRAAAGFAGETLSEGLEEGTTQLTANVAQSQIDPNTGLSTGVGQAAGLGAAAGGGLGLITGALTPGLRTVQPGESIPVEPGPGLRTVQPGESIPVEPGPVPAEVSPEQATTFARTRLRELITKGKGTPDISFVDPATGQTRTTPGRPAENLSDNERTELEFLANNAENPSALGKAYNLKIKGAAEQRLNEAATAADAVQAAADMVDMDIEALEREAGIDTTAPAAPQPQGLLAQAMAPSAEPSLTLDTLEQADVSTMPAPERQEFLDDLTAARTANLPDQREQALQRAAETYGRTVGPIQDSVPAAAEPVRMDMQALVDADTRSMAPEDRTEFVTQLNTARTAQSEPVRQAALTRAAEVYGRAVSPVEPRRIAAPRPTNLLGRRAEQYTDTELQALIDNDGTPAVTRRGAEVELRARTVSTPQEETANVEKFITIPEPMPNLAAQPVAGQSAGQRARATAQRAIDNWAASRGEQSPVVFGEPAPDLEQGIAGVADLLGQQFGAEVVPFSDTSPTAINGVALGNRLMINVGSTQLGVPNTAFHELTHYFENIAKAEEAAGKTDTPAQELVEQLYSIFDDMEESGKRSYIENLLHAEDLADLTGDEREAFISSKLNAPLTRSEMVADFMNNRATDKEFLQGLAKADPTGFEAFVKRWLAVLDNMLAKLRGAKGKARNRLESVKVDSYIRDLNKAKLTAQSALINYRKATQPAATQQAPDDLAATSNDVAKAEAFEDKYGILPYTSAGQLTVDAKFSIKQSGDFGTHPILGIPINKNGSVSLYFPTDNATAQLVRREKLLRASDPSATRVFLTNESSAPKVAANPGEIQQPMAGANVLVQVNPDLVQLLKEYPDGRKDFFIPIAEGATFKAKMTKLFTLNAPRDQGLHPDRTLAEINDGISAAVNRLQAASTQARKVIVSAARKVLRADHNVGTLLGENDKLAKTRTGDYGIEYNGKRVYSLGLGLASAQKINNKQKLTSCPQSAICESLCLGETSGQNLLYGGVGQFRSGPRLAQYLKTEAMVVHPEEFTSVLYAEIASFRLAMMKEGKQPTVRLNVTSDFAPKVWEPLIKAFPDVMFYDYTKLATDPIAENHHLTYSSTGASQIVDGKLVENKLSNWPKMVQRLREGKNVAMAFTSKTDMPDFIVDEATGERFQVWNGDNYDARFLDPKPGDPANKLNKGMIVGLTNKDRTGDAQTAAARTDGFFMDYDRKRDGDTLTIRDPRTLGSAASRPVKIQFSRSQKETSGAIKATPGVDMVRMARLLGPQLYGNMSDIGLVTIKEVFQNSFDALKGAIQKGDKNIGRIDIDVSSFDRTITITDDGTGMTPETINKAFLTLAGTSKETDRASGGLGIAKMLFLFGNESLSLRTVRNGVESTLSTSGAELMASFSDPSVAPDIQTRSTSDPSGTTVTIKIPATYTDENGEVQAITFPYSYLARSQLVESPLMENIEVRLNDEVLPIGSSFPAEDYTVLANAKFAWGNMRVLVRPRDESEYGPNIQVLSNGLFQFDDVLKKNPLDFWGPAAPFKFYFNIEPSVPADSPLYPIALNRKAFSASAKADFDALKKYLSVLYANKTDAEDAQSFGELEQLSEDGKTFKRISLVVPEADQGSTLAINPGDKVEIREGRMYVNNREMPEITKESMAKLVRDPGKFRIDPSLIDPSRVLVHDNLTLSGVPFREVMRDSVGDAFDDFTFEVAEVFKNLRDAVAKVGGAKYSDVSDVAVGVSFDLEYYGVNIMVPFRAMMINPAFIRGEDPAKAAQTVVGTMIHELAHHAERNHSETGFIPELQRMFMELSLSRDSEAITRQLQNVFNKYPDIMRELRRIQDNEKENLKPKGVRLKGDADTTGVGGMDVGQKARDGASAAARLSAPGGARRDDSDLPGIRRAVEGSGRNRPTGEERRRPSSADGGYDPGLAFRDLIPQFSRGQLRTTDPSAADEFIAFSKRQKPAPKKTVTAYKLFRVDARRPGQLFPLFVNANEPVPFNEWQDADIGPLGEGGKVKSKLGLLAFRPGWHAGDLPIATHIGSKSDSSLRAPDVRSENHVWAEVEMAADRDWQKVADERGRNAQGKIIGARAQISDQIPEDGFYRYKTSPNMVGKWIIGGSMKVNRLLSDEEVASINTAAGARDLRREKPFDADKYGFDVAFSRSQGETPSQQRGINVRNDGDNLYADLIVDGEKTMESRNTNSLRAYVGQTVGIIRTGEGPAKLIGSVKIGEPIEVDEQEFRELEPEHMVPEGSAFDIKPGSTKFLYPLTEARRFDEERAVDSRGIVARNVAFSRAQTDTPAFKRWFGNSKVVGENGAPLMVYTGTSKDSDFSAFKIPKNGAWFTSDPQIASEYAMENDSKGFKQIPGTWKYKEVNTASRVIPVFLRIENPAVLSDADSQTLRYATNYRRAQGQVFDKLRAQGYDGVDMGDGIWVVLKTPTQIKSAIGNTGAFDPAKADIRFSQAQKSPLKLYSALARAVEAGPTKGQAQQWKGFLRNQKGVTPGEIEWSGVEDWLDLQSGSVSREAVTEFLAENGVQVGEVVLGGTDVYPDDFWRSPFNGNEMSYDDWVQELEESGENPEEAFATSLVPIGGTPRATGTGGYTKYAGFQLPGGDNYREVLLTLPVENSGSGFSGYVGFQTLDDVEDFLLDMSSNGLDDEDYGHLGNSLTVGFENFTVSTFSALSQFAVANRGVVIDLPVSGYKPVKTYKSTHWDQLNVLAHIRMNDRVDADGNRVLFVEEIQSDWAQEGRKMGFAPKSLADAEMVATINNSANVPYWEVRTTSGDFVASVVDVSTMTGTPEQAITVAREIARRRVDRRAPVAPFVQSTNSWLNLALKRVIAMAVEGGYDKVAFINGEQSADRYDLSNHLKSLRYRKSEDGTFQIAGQDVNDAARDLGRAVPEQDLENLVGKEIAKKILAGEGETLKKYPKFRVLSGLDLKVGGEGMKDFYDSIVPKAVAKLLPKIGGGKLEQVNLESDDVSSKYIVDAEDIGADEDFEQEVVIRNERSLEGVASFNSIAEAEAWLDDNDVDVSAKMQPGFAVTPAMTDQVMDVGLPMFSRAQNIFGKPMPAATWQIEDSVLDTKLIYVFQDKLVDTKRVVEAINSAVGQIEDKWDPYLQEKVYHGVVAKQTKDFADKDLKPLIETMGRNKVTLEEFDQYLHNRHAEERNVAIAKRNLALPDAGSGIPTADARAYLSGLPAARRMLLEGLARKIDSITKGTRDILVSSGLEAQSTIDAWDAVYKKYVPLMREELDYEGTKGPGTGRGFSVRGSSSRRAVGSADRRVVDIMANIAMQRERAIVRAAKNKVSQAVYGLALKNPSPDFWLPINPDGVKDPQALAAELINLGIDPLDAQNIAQEPKESYVDPRTGLVSTRVNRRLRGLPNVVYTRVNGKDRFLVLNNKNPRAERMAIALNNLDVDSLNAALRMAAIGTRWFASVNTQYNPIFGIINLARDLGAGGLNLTTTALADKKGEVISNSIPALRGIYKNLRGRGGQNQWSALWEEFQEIGGQTGFRDQFSQSEERARALQSELDNLSAGGLKKAGQATLNWLSDYNTAMENAVRLSAYKAALDKGLSKQRAAELAKDLTVNFNKKGSVSTQMGALYAFFNASVQGTTRMAQTLKGPSGKKIMYGGLLLGAVQAVALMAAGFEDDEPPGFIKERNLVIPIGGGDYLTWPMPLGFNVIPNVGRIATEWALSGFERTPDRAIEMATSFFDMFNPIGNAGLSMQTVAPTLADPFAALAQNKDWTGTPISREDLNSLAPTPGYLRARDSASWFATELARFFNLASGGTDYTPGKFSPTPEQLEYLAGQVTGGVGREVGKAVKTAETLATGEELPPYAIPLAGRLYGKTTGSAAESNRFYDNIRRMNLHNAELRGLRESRQSVGPYLRDNPDARLATQARAAYRQVQNLRRRKREMLERNASRESIRLIDQQITTRMMRFNERVSRIEN